jgi:hypothetical protein
MFIGYHHSSITRAAQSFSCSLYATPFSISINMSGWAHKATHAPRPLSDLLCVPICFIPPVVPHLCQSTVSYIKEYHHSHLIPYKCLPTRRNLNSSKDLAFFSSTSLVVHISPTRFGPVPRRDRLRHCYHHLSVMQPSARCLTPCLGPYHPPRRGRLGLDFGGMYIALKL